MNEIRSICIYHLQMEQRPKSLKPESLKYLEENTGSTCHAIGVGKAFLIHT